jgi:Acyl-CoA dehydrogenase, N-terminal domain
VAKTETVVLVTANGGVAEYLAAIQRLAPLIKQHRRHLDEQRRAPDEVFTAFADAGFFRLYLPKTLGGPELSPFDFMTAVEAASALDGSIGWLVGNGGGMSRIAGYLPEEVARDWFADPHAFVVSATGAIGTAEPVEGGFRVSGRWPFGSGAHHATRFMGLASIKTADGREAPPICCYFAGSDVELDDTWSSPACVAPAVAISRFTTCLCRFATRIRLSISNRRIRHFFTVCPACRRLRGPSRSSRSGLRGEPSIALWSLPARRRGWAPPC